MLLIMRTIVTAFFLLSALTLAEPNLPENIDQLKQQLVTYHDSGAYYQDISAIVKQARDYMQFRLIQNQRAAHPAHLALVMDIDETVLSNYNDLVKLQFGGSTREIIAHQVQGHDPAIPFTRSLYDFAVANNIKVFFITARDESQRAATEANLRKVGFNQWVGLYLKPENYSDKSTAPYKIAVRKQIIRNGYDIIVNIGAQESDFKGGYADMSFKMPNPYYSIS